MARIDPQLRNQILARGFKTQDLYNRDPMTSAMGLVNPRRTLSYLPGELMSPIKSVSRYINKRKQKKAASRQKQDAYMKALDNAIQTAERNNSPMKLKFNPYTGYSYE